MQYRDRIKELRRVPAGELQENARNWRRHPSRQKEALKGVLSEIGYADAALARELSDGSLELIDGHLRKDTAGDTPIPVLILDVNEEEANKILATHDPLAQMAMPDFPAFADLKDTFGQFNDPKANVILNDLLGLTKQREQFDRKRNAIAPSWDVIVKCHSAQEQQDLYERLINDGLQCKLATLETGQ